MSATAEARSLFAEIAGPMPAGSQIKEMLHRVERETRIGMRRLRGIWNNEARLISCSEMDALRAAAKRKRRAREAEDRDEFRSLSDELAAMQRRMEALVEQLARSAPHEEGGALDGAGSSDRSLAGAR